MAPFLLFMFAVILIKLMDTFLPHQEIWLPLNIFSSLSLERSKAVCWEMQGVKLYTCLLWSSAVVPAKWILSYLPCLWILFFLFNYFMFQSVMSIKNSRMSNCSTASEKMTGRFHWTMRWRCSWEDKDCMKSMLHSVFVICW